MTKRITQMQAKISRLKKENKQDKKDLQRVKRWAEKNPTKDLRVPGMGLVTPNQLKTNIKQHQAKIQRQSEEIKTKEKRLRELKRG